MPVFFSLWWAASREPRRSAPTGGGRRAMGWFLCRTDRLIRPTTAFLLALGGAALLAPPGVDSAVVGMGAAGSPACRCGSSSRTSRSSCSPRSCSRCTAGRDSRCPPRSRGGGVRRRARLLGGPAVLSTANYLLAWAAVTARHRLAGGGPRLRGSRVAVPMIAGGLAALVLLTVPGLPVSTGDRSRRPPAEHLAADARAARPGGHADGDRPAPARARRAHAAPYAPWTAVVPPTP